MKKPSLRALFALLALLALGVVAVWSPDEVQPADVFVLHGVTLIDGNGGPPLQDAVVVIKNGRIEAVGPPEEIRVSQDARVESGSGKFLLPGLTDVHAHALVPTCRQSTGFDWVLSERLMRALLRFGITTARSPATPTALGIAMRDSIASGDILGPRLLVAGDFINGRQRTPSEVREEVRAQATAGVDYIKLYSQLTPDAVEAGIAEAHALHVPVIGHLQRTTWTEGLNAGIDHLTHAAPWTEEMLRPDKRGRYRQARSERGLIRSRIDWLEALEPDGAEVAGIIAILSEWRIPIDPTLVAFDTKFSFDSAASVPVSPRYRENPNREAARGLPAVWEACGTPTNDWTADDFRRAEAAWSKLLALVRRYHEGGVLLTTGSDTPNSWVIPGESLHREMELLVDAGIPPADVIRIATRNGAEALGLLSEIGTVEPGKRADLVLLNANPLLDITNTRSIEWVMRDGVRYLPEAME